MNILDQTSLVFKTNMFFMSYNVGLKRRYIICREALLQSMPLSYQYIHFYTRLEPRLEKKLQLSFTLLHMILFFYIWVDTSSLPVILHKVPV